MRFVTSPRVRKSDSSPPVSSRDSDGLRYWAGGGALLLAEAGALRRRLPPLFFRRFVVLGMAVWVELRKAAEEKTTNRLQDSYKIQDTTRFPNHLQNQPTQP